MKVKVNNPKNTYKYPMLAEMKSMGLIVLLSKHQCGVCIKAGDTSNIVGEFADDWSHDLTPFTGSITMEND